MSNSIIPFISSELTLSEDVQKKFGNLATLMTGKNDALEGMEGGWRPATVKVVQPVTTDPGKPDNAKTGDLFHRGGAIKKPLRGLVAYAYHTRVRFVPNEDKRPSCSSEKVDVFGRGKQDKSISIYGDKCSECPHNDQPFTGGKRTNCNNTINIIFVPESLENVFHLQFSKSSYTVGQTLLGLVKATMTPWERFYELSSEVKKRDKASGLYAVPTITPIADVIVPEYLKQFSAYVRDQMKVVRAEQQARTYERRTATEDATNLDTIDAQAESAADYKDAI